MMNGCKILVLTVGGSLDPVEISLRQHSPDFVYFIPSRTSEGDIPSVVKRGCPAGFTDYRTFVVEDHDDLISCFRPCHAAFSEIRERHGSVPVVADLTGGTKVMSAALILAAADLGAELSISYVSGERAKNGLGAVIRGTERLKPSIHPFTLIAKSEKERFCQFFNSSRYTAAKDICDDVVDTSNGDLRELFKALRKVTDGYRWWDWFNLKTAGHELEGGCGMLKRLLEHAGFPAPIGLQRFADDVEASAAQLKRIGDSQKLSFELIDDLVSNARRRGEEGKYDDAVARLYRATEMIAQWRFFSVFGCGTSKFPLSKLGSGVKAEIFPHSSSAETENIGCRDAFSVLAAQGDEYGRRWQDNERDLIGLLNARNESILAHGTKALKEKQYAKFIEIVERVFGIAGSVRFARLDTGSILEIGLASR